MNDYTFLFAKMMNLPRTMLATKCPFRTDFRRDAYCLPHYRSTLGGRATERACDALPLECPHIRNMTESPFRQKLLLKH